MSQRWRLAIRAMAIVYVAHGLYCEMFQHDIPKATLLMCWAILSYVVTLKN